jgi:uncharacterized repeat protein (TIGR03803 family)
MRRKVFIGLRAALTILTVTLFVTATAASQETVLHRFDGKDGYQPASSLIFDTAGNLYGTAAFGGASVCNSSGCGTVFELTPKVGGGWTAKVLHSFSHNGKDGYIPENSLVFDGDGNLYGTTEGGGTGACNGPFGVGCGTVFELKPTAGGNWEEMVLHSFKNKGGDAYYPYTGLVLDGSGNLYGTTSSGGAYGSYGTVFELTRTVGGGWTETVLHSFGGNQSDGTLPDGGLILDAAGNLYGTTYYGGTYGRGTVFQLTPATGGSWTETVLHTFNDNGTDGTEPEGSLIFDASGNLYGTTFDGGAHGYGTVYELTPSAGGSWTETVLHSFTVGAGGNYPQAGLTIDVAGNLYGTTGSGGTGTCIADTGCGTVFELMPRPEGGWAEKVLYSFQNNGKDGNFPHNALTFDSSGNLYGTTNMGGGSKACNTLGLPGCGTVFEITP